MRKRINTWLLGATLLFFCNIAEAQVGPCPPGMSQYPGRNGIPSCGPLRSDYDQPQGRWQDQWGALAAGEDGTIGLSSNQSTENAAKEIAVDNCALRGGKNCKTTSTYRNGCIALVNGNNIGYSSRDSTREKVIKNAMKSCNRAGENNCEIFRVECSQAKWVGD